MAAAQSAVPAPPPPLPRPPTSPPEHKDHPPCPSLSPSPRPLHCPGLGMSSALPCSPPRQQQSDADAVLVQQLANSPTPRPQSHAFFRCPSSHCLYSIPSFDAFHSFPLGQIRAVRGQRCCLLYYCLKYAVLVFTVVAW